MPPDEAAKLSAFMLEKSKTRRDLIFKVALIGGGVLGIGAVLWLFFRKDETKINPDGKPLQPGEESLAALKQETKGTDCYNLHYRFNYLQRQDKHTEAEQVRKQAASAGCLWAKE